MEPENKYPEVTFSSEGKGVVSMKVELSSPDRENASFTFVHRTQPGFDEHIADLLCETLTEELAEVKRAAYELGLKHGRAKKARTQKDFCGDFDKVDL